MTHAGDEVESILPLPRSLYSWYHWHHSHQPHAVFVFNYLVAWRSFPISENIGDVVVQSFHGIVFRPFLTVESIEGIGLTVSLTVTIVGVCYGSTSVRGPNIFWFLSMDSVDFSVFLIMLDVSRAMLIS